MRWHTLTMAALIVTCSVTEVVGVEGLTLPQIAAVLESGQEPVRIACLGDSVTGVYYHTGGRRAWPEMLGIALRKTYPQAKIEVFNAGVSGNTTTDALERMGNDVFAHKPHLVVVMFGLNDIQRRTGGQFYRDNLKAIIDRCRAFRAAVLLCTLNSVYPNEPRPMSAIAEYSQIVRDVAKENSLKVADCFRAYEDVRAKSPTEWMLLMNEEIHPCMDGHKLFAGTVAETISGKPVSLADVPPLADSLKFTLARLKAGQPVSIIAMPPYDRILPEVLTELFPQAKISTTTWPVEGRSLPAMVEWAKGIRDRRPNLIVPAVPANVEAKDDASFIGDYHWIISWSIARDNAEWDILPILPSVTASLTPDQLDRTELARRIILGGDVAYVDRKSDDRRPARQIVMEWIRQRERQP